MTLIIRLISLAALLSSSVNALSVSQDVRARHHHIAREGPDAEDLVEKNVGRELEERGNDKVGLAWTGNSPSNLKYFVSSNTKYMMTWSPYCLEDAHKYGLICCPMLWGYKHIGQFQQLKRKGGKCIMGMNEVNVPSQGFLTPPQGVALWNEYIRPLHNEGYYLITPSVTSGDDGVTWFKEFFQQCGGPGKHCQANGIAFHFYGTDVNNFISWAHKFHDVFGGGDVWVTEMACQNFGDPRKGQCSKDHVWAFMDGATAWMKQTSWIKAYFWFGLFQDMYNVNPENRLVDAHGLPNALGKHYLGKN